MPGTTEPLRLEEGAKTWPSSATSTGRTRFPPPSSTDDSGEAQELGGLSPPWIGGPIVTIVAFRFGIGWPSL